LLLTTLNRKQPSLDTKDTKDKHQNMLHKQVFMNAAVTSIVIGAVAARGQACSEVINGVARIPARAGKIANYVSNSHRSPALCLPTASTRTVHVNGIILWRARPKHASPDSL